MTDRDPDAGGRPTGRITRTGTEARQGRIVLGRFGRWIWGASFALLIVLFLILSF